MGKGIPITIARPASNELPHHSRVRQTSVPQTEGMQNQTMNGTPDDVFSEPRRNYGEGRLTEAADRALAA